MAGRERNREMSMDLQGFAEYIRPMTCILSVEKLPDGSCGDIRVVTGNHEFINKAFWIYNNIANDEAQGGGFVPGQSYEQYIPKNENFEDMCYRSAVLGETLHSYVRPEKVPMWLYMTLMPLCSDREDISYCSFTQVFMDKPDYSLMTDISPDISSQVLKICIKLRGTNDFFTSMNEVISDIRDLCDAGHCCVLMTDFAQRKCSVLCEALSKTTHLLSMKTYVNDDFFAIVETWHDTIARNSGVVIKDERDWEYLKETNPVWYNTIQPAGAESIVLFPLRFRGETLGYIWAINFDVSLSIRIKEMLELTTYFLASELANYQLFLRLKKMSSIDLLTGVKNRNAMNNRVDNIVSGADERQSEENLGVVFADLNGLKRVNDREGHFAGDLLLKDAALMLQRHFPNCEIYRAGGDEFMVLVFGIGEEELAKKAQKLRVAASDPDGVCFAVGWSFDTVGSISRAIRAADENMYEDKKLFYQRYPERKRSE